jgi:hypothetical protein
LTVVALKKKKRLRGLTGKETTNLLANNKPFGKQQPFGKQTNLTFGNRQPAPTRVSHLALFGAGVHLLDGVHLVGVHRGVAVQRCI